MKRSQLNAISRSYREKEQKKQVAEAQARGLLDIFKNQTIYKTLGGFLAADTKSAKFKKVLNEATMAADELNKKAEHIRRCGGKYSEQSALMRTAEATGIRKAIEQIKNKS